MNAVSKEVTEVAMKVNQANMVKSLKFSFTNKTTVLGELMQNARRAGATGVEFVFDEEGKTLTVIDDGKGIESIEALLTVAESGWDADTIAHEHPFGIGFLAALFACKHITVTSKSGIISALTEDILAFKPIKIVPMISWDRMTKIVLSGVELNLRNLEQTLQELSLGFPIPVSLNDEEFDRNCATTSGRTFIDTEVGKIFLGGVEAPGDTCSNITVYLQGLPIYRSYQSFHYRPTNPHIIHLDSSKFYARLPDRDKLIDESEVVRQIKTVLYAEIRKKMESYKETFAPELFVNYYPMMKQWDCVDLLNDVMVLPKNILSQITEYPVCDEVHWDYITLLDQCLKKEEIEGHEIVSLDDYINSDGGALSMFVWERGSYIYSGGLDSGHWLLPMVRILEMEEPVIELVNETHEAYFSGSWVSCKVKFCDSYTIKVGVDIVTITGDAMWLGDDEDIAIVPKGDTSGSVIRQISSFKTDSDEFQESACDCDVEDFSKFVVANTASDPADAMKQLLPGFHGCPMLYNSSFMVVVGDRGYVKAVAVLDDTANLPIDLKRVSNALRDILVAINRDKDGGFFLCEEAEELINEANLALVTANDLRSSN